MNVIDEKQFYAEVVSPFLDRLKSEVIPALRTEVLDPFLNRLENGIIPLLLQGVKGEGHSAAAEIGALLAGFVTQLEGIMERLDGWTLDLGPVTLHTSAKGLGTTAYVLPPAAAEARRDGVVVEAGTVGSANG